jgi:hypothetical protein
LTPLRNCQFTPGSQRQSRGKRCVSQGWQLETPWAGHACSGAVHRRGGKHFHGRQLLLRPGGTKLTFLSSKLTFLSAKLTFLRCSLLEISRSPGSGSSRHPTHPPPTETPPACLVVAAQQQAGVPLQNSKSPCKTVYLPLSYSGNPGINDESGGGRGAAGLALGAIQQQTMWARLLAVVEEQATALLRTAMSTIVREGGDLSCGIFVSG